MKKRKQKGDCKTMKMKKFIAVVSMVGMLAAAMTGCGSGSDDAKDADKGGDAKYAGDWDSANDITVVSREDGSGTRGAFIELFGIQEEVDGEKVDMTTTEAQITNNTSVMMTTVEGNEYAIGYISLGSLDEDAVKALKIDGAEATAENIENGSYKVSRPFNVAVKKDLDNEAAKDFMSFIMSTEGQKVVEEAGYIPVSDVQAYAGTKPEAALRAMPLKFSKSFPRTRTISPLRLPLSRKIRRATALLRTNPLPLQARQKLSGRFPVY